MIFCTHGNFELVRFKTANGHIQLRKYCKNCKDVFGTAIAQEKFGHDINRLRIIETKHYNDPCAVCGDKFTTYHHWFPQSIARKNGVNAERWPGAYLCSRCHALWHKLVTPGLLDENWNG